MTETVSVTVKETKITCDICGETVQGRGCGQLIRPCPGCGRDTCKSCGTCWFIDPWSGEDSGDNSPRYCFCCEKRLHRYANEAAKVRNSAQTTIEKLRDNWLSDCKEDPERKADAQRTS